MAFLLIASRYFSYQLVDFHVFRRGINLIFPAILTENLEKRIVNSGSFSGVQLFWTLAISDNKKLEETYGSTNKAYRCFDKRW